MAVVKGGPEVRRAFLDRAVDDLKAVARGRDEGMPSRDAAVIEHNVIFPGTADRIRRLGV